jgi:hypothetical protein
MQSAATLPNPHYLAVRGTKDSPLAARGQDQKRIGGE